MFLKAISFAYTLASSKTYIHTFTIEGENEGWRGEVVNKGGGAKDDACEAHKERGEGLW